MPTTCFLLYDTKTYREVIPPVCLEFNIYNICFWRWGFISTDVFPKKQAELQPVHQRLAEYTKLHMIGGKPTDNGTTSHGIKTVVFILYTFGLPDPG